MEFLEHMSAAFLVVLQPINLFALFVGLVLGMLVAVLPGLTLVMGIVLALPFTYGMAIMPSITLLTAMYVSGTYGGAFTAILFRIPGEPLDVPLLWDGYTMAHSGEPAKALGWTLFAALAGGPVSTIAVALSVQPVASFALRFDAPDLFAVILFALSGVVALGGSSLANAFISLFLGLIIASVGVDPVFGESRLTLGIPILGTCHVYSAGFLTHAPLPLEGQPRVEKTAWQYTATFFNHFPYVTTPSEAMRQRLLSAGLRVSFAAVSNGVDTGLFHPRSLFHPNPQLLTLLHVGRLGYEKRVDMVLHAFGRIAQVFPQVRLVIVGYGHQASLLQEEQYDHKSLQERYVYKCSFRFGIGVHYTDITIAFKVGEIASRCNTDWKLCFC